MEETVRAQIKGPYFKAKTGYLVITDLLGGSWDLVASISPVSQSDEMPSRAHRPPRLLQLRKEFSRGACLVAEHGSRGIHTPGRSGTEGPTRLEELAQASNLPGPPKYPKQWLLMPKRAYGLLCWGLWRSR